MEWSIKILRCVRNHPYRPLVVLLLCVLVYVSYTLVFRRYNNNNNNKKHILLDEKEYDGIYLPF